MIISFFGQFNFTVICLVFLNTALCQKLRLCIERTLVSLFVFPCPLSRCLCPFLLIYAYFLDIYSGYVLPPFNLTKRNY